MPRELCDYTGTSAADYSTYLRARRAWFLAHGTNPGDWAPVRAINAASRAAYGLPDNTALARARLRVSDA